jgi:hypothetical protein
MVEVAMASWDYDPVNVPVVRGGERDADVVRRPEEGQVDEPDETPEVASAES